MLRVTWGVALVAVALAGCGTPDRCSSTAAVAQAIFVPHCTTSTCHSQPNPAAGLDFTATDIDSEVINVAAQQCSGQIIVVAGDPDASYLIHKVSDTKPPCGGRMPLAQPALSADDISCLRSWVASRPRTSSPPDLATSLICPTGQLACSGACVDPTTSRADCGSCGNSCAIACASGACVTSCPSGTSNCSGSCVNTTSDTNNCNGCGKICPAGQICAASQCTCGATVSFSSQIQPIFSANCATSGCHAGARPQASLDLSSGRAYANLVNVASATCSGLERVVPSRVDKSYIINKLTGVGICSGTQMPKSGGALPASQIDLVRAWICNGALNN